MSARTTSDVVIIGAGLIGCTIGRLLAVQGRRVIIVDRDSPGRRATWAAGGMLSPLIESDADDPFFHIADRSFDLYAPLIAEIQEESGMSVDYRRAGKLQCASNDTDAAELERLAASPRAARYGLRLMDGAQARTGHPMLSHDIQSALFVERDHCVDNRLLAQAMASAAAARGADLRIGSGVQEIIRNGSSAGGVALASGERITADHVVLAAGAWSASVEGIPRPLPVKPIRGQMLALDARTTATFTSFEPVIGTSHCYMIPRSDGRLVIGATVEDVGFDAGPTPEGLAWLIDAATAVVPGVGALPVLETWAGYRPGTPDDWPVLGPDPEMKGLHFATGHYRNGILLAPVTAEVISASIEGSVPTWAKPFAIERFR